MLDFLGGVFDSSGFPPRWRCGTWTPTHGWLHVTADSLIFSAYFTIPVLLWYFARRRPDWPFRHLLWLFGAFILACGTTHLMEAVIFWWPAYRLAGVLKAVTAVVSWATVAALVPALPRALAMRTPEELGREVAARQAAEADLLRANAELEDRVRARTAELTAANAALAAERERFRTTLASIGDGVIATDPAGRVTFLNPAAEGHTGWSAAAAAGQPLQAVFRIVHETTREDVENPALRALRDGSTVGLANHTVLLGRAGGERPIDDCAAPIRDGAGGVAGAVLVFRDVSERRRAEAAQAEQARLTALRADVATTLSADQPEGAALQACCEAVVRHLGAAFARIWTLPAGGDTLDLQASAGLYTHLDGPHGRVRVGQFKIGRIAASGEPHLTNAVADDPNVSDPEWAAREGMVAFAGHPLAVEGRVVGVMALFARRPLPPAVLSDLARVADGIAQYIDRRRAEAQIRDSEERYRLFFEASPLPMWVYDRHTLAFLEVNTAAVAKYGYSRAEFLCMTVRDIRPAGELPALLAVMATAAGPDGRSVWQHRLRDGRVIRVRVVTHNLTFRGRPARLVQAQDVTEQLRAEEELRASEKRYRLLFEANPHPMWVFDRGTLGFLAVNDAAVAKYGYSRQEFLARSIKDIRPPEDVPALLASVAAPADGLDDAGVWRHQTKDGRVIRVRIVSHALAFDGRPAEVVMAQDVTDQLRAEEELRASEERFRAFMDHSPAAAWVTDADGRMAYLSASFRRTFRLPPDEVVGRPVTELYPPEVADVYLRNIRAVADSGEVLATTEPGVRADGTPGEFLVYKFPLPGPGGGRQVGGVAVDVTDLRAAEAALRASEERLQLALSAGGMGTFDWDVAGGGIVWSASHYELFGYDPAHPFPVEHHHFSDRVHPDDRPGVERVMREAMAGRTLYAHEYRVLRPDGSERWLAGTGRFQYDDAGRAVRMVGVVQDISGRKGLEVQVRQAQKLEAIGHLAGGVAHDFNNLLTVVNGCGELLLADLPPDSPARPLAEAIIGAGERGAGLTRQLLAFSRQQMLRVEVFDPNLALADTAKLLARLLGEDVALRLALDPAAGSVRADIGQVDQVVINLAVNARDAMPRGGSLVIETAAAEVAATDPLLSPDARPGRYVRLAVTDTGVGMPPAVQARLFEPFFTTKPAGKGTGLGLATVYGIVRQSGGFMTVQSEPGRGTTFAVYLPRHEAEPDGPPSALRPKPKPAGGETVLVVEDDEAVRALATAILEREGYRVEAAEDGEAAMAVCDRLSAPPDLVLTDVIMPGMSGRELAETLTARHPRLQVVFLSGYTADAVLRHGVEEERVAFLQKPYTPDSLARFVRQVLDGAGTG